MVAKTACFELKKYTYIPILKFYFPCFVPCWSWMCSLDLLCVSLQPWNGESGTSLLGGLWQMMMWSVWRAPNKKWGLVNGEDRRRHPQGPWGLVSAPSPLTAMPYFPLACALRGHALLSRSALHHPAFPCLPKGTPCLYFLSNSFGVVEAVISCGVEA